MSVASSLRADVLRTMGPGIGRDMTVLRPVTGIYDPETGAVVYPSGTVEGDQESYPGRGRLGNYRDALVDGLLIKQNDRRVTIVMTDTSFLPQVNDRLQAGDDVYVIQNVQPREFDGEWICFTLQVRR